MQRGKLIATVIVGGLALIVVTAAVTWEIVTRHGIANQHSAPAADGNRRTVADSQDVYPAELRDTKSLELGQLVLLLMPDSGSQYIGWDYRVNSPILWQTSGFNEFPMGGAERVGLVRVNIQGSTATVLRQRVEELGWSVIYSTNKPAKFGPREIDIRPGTPTGDGQCFGTNFDGCDFKEPTASLLSAGIQVKKLCAKQWGAEGISVFLLAHSDRKPTILVWQTSGGSGGSSSWLTLKLNDEPGSNLCDRYSESPR
jgi:hypothetical protein